MKWRLALFLALVLATPALAWRHGGAGAAPPPTIAVLIASGAGSNPAVNPAQLGSNSLQTPVGDFDEPPNVWINQGDTTHAITIGAATGNRGWIKQVTFCIAGNCTAAITPQIINPRTGDVGWTFIPTSIGGTDGDYTISAYVTPVNGFERKVDLPITINNNGTLTRAQRYIDAVSGNDANDGLSLGTAWKSVLKATLSAPSGSQVYSCGDETYLEDSNTGTFNNNARMIDFIINPACAGSGYFTISRTSRTAPAEPWNPRANKLRFDHVHIDMGKMVQIQGSGAGSILWISNATLIDANGPDGPAYGYTSLNSAGGVPELAQTPFGSTASNIYITESTLSTVITAGIELARNLTMTVGWDLVAYSGPNNNNAAMFNVQGIKSGDFKQRLSLEQPSSLVPLSAIFSGGKTTLTYSAGVTLSSAVSGTAACIQIVGGPLDGDTFPVFSQTPDPSTPNTVVTTGAAGICGPNTVVTGDASSIGAGQVFTYVVAHADSMQFIQLTANSVPIGNIYVQRYKATANGNDLQALLSQPTPPITNTGTISTTGTAITFSGSQTLEKYDCIQIGSGAQQYESQPITADVSGTTGTLANAYTVDQSGVSWHQGKTIKDFAIVASIIDGSNNNLAQPQGCEINNVFVQDTLGTSTFRFRTATNGFGMWGDALYDSLWNGSTASANSMTSDNPPVAFPTVGIDIDNNQFGVGTARGTNGVQTLATFASAGSGGSYKPSGGTVTKQLSGMVGNPNYPDGTPLFPFAYDLTPLTSSSVVGAQQP